MWNHKVLSAWFAIHLKGPPVDDPPRPEGLSFARLERVLVGFGLVWRRLRGLRFLVSVGLYVQKNRP